MATSIHSSTSRRFDPTLEELYFFHLISKLSMAYIRWESSWKILSNRINYVARYSEYRMRLSFKISVFAIGMKSQNALNICEFIHFSFVQ